MWEGKLTEGLEEVVSAEHKLAANHVKLKDGLT